MHLADHIRPLLRDHDCVIIPDFGGLVADVSPARAQPGRQALSPPTKLVAFNQALTRNDGLLVDALSQHLNLPIAQAREAVRTAVAGLQRELDETNRTELPGIGIFRRAAGRGLAFEYTGTDNLLAAAFGLPELAARPVRASETRPRLAQPALRGAATRRSRWSRLMPGGIIAVATGLLLLVNYQVAQNVGYLPAGWQVQFPKLEWATRRAVSPVVVTEPQQATLAQHNFYTGPIGEEGITPLSEASSVAAPGAEVQPAAVAFDSTAAYKTAVAVPSKAEPVAKPAETTAATVATVATAPVPVVASKKANPAEKPARAVTPKPVAAGSSTTIKYRTGRFYVIAGAYSNLKGAEVGRKNLVRAGHQARIILPHPGSRLFRLTAADFSDLASAQREARRLRTTTHSDYNTFAF